MSTLIGDEANAQVRFLRERLDLIRAGAAVPRVVIFEGAAGSGKSRVLREFYGSLQRDQPTNSMLQGYWSALADDTVLTPDGGPDIAAMQTIRNTIGPRVATFTRPPETLPTFFWWPMSCRLMDDGSLVEVAATLMPQLSAHLPYLAEQRRKQGPHTTLRGISDKALQQAKDLKGDLALESIGQALTAFDISAPGYGTVLAKMWEGALKLRERRALNKDVARGGALRIERSGAGEIAKQLSRLACENLPIIVAIDDLQDMGRDLAGLLDLLAQPTFPALVVATTSVGADQKVYRRWVRAAVDSGLAEVLPVPDLTAAEARELAGRFAVDADVAGLAARFPNPWALTLAMAHPKLGGRLRRGLEPEIEEAPPSIRGFYTQQWKALSAPVREVLKVASVASSAAEESTVWPVLSSGVARTADGVWEGDHSYAVEQALTSRWLGSLDAGSRFLLFTEWLRGQIARDDAQDQLDDEQRQSIYSGYLTRVTKWLRSNAEDEGSFNDPSVRAAARVYLDRLEEMPQDKAVLRLAVRAVCDARDAVMQRAEADQTWDRFIDPGDIDWNNQADLRDMHTVATRRWALGKRKSALEILNAVLRHRDETLGRRHEETMKARKDLAWWYSAVGAYGRALRLSNALLEDRLATIGPDHADTLSTRGNIAAWTGQTGHPQQALTLFQQLLPDRQRVLGPDHPDTLKDRHNIAAMTGQTGHPHQALTLFQQLLPDQQRVLGNDHPDTLGTRHNIAFWTGETGHPHQALTMLEQLAPDQQRVLGTDHPDTLSTRGSIAFCTGQVGHSHQAFTLFQQLLPDQQRVLGDDHPDTLAIRSNIAGWTGQTGHPHQALTLFQQLLPDQQRVLGPDHPETLAIRNNIAGWAGLSGQPQLAVTLFEQLLPDQERVLGPDHPDTLNALASMSVFKSAWEALDSQAQHGPFDSPLAHITGAIHSGSVLATVAALIAGCRAFGNAAMLMATLSLPEGQGTQETAWLQLVDSGYDPWKVGIWWQYPGAALAAALNAIDEEDPEDLRLILQLNSETAQEYGGALHLLIGDRAGPPTADERTALEYIAAWVVPGTALAERAKAIAAS